MSTQYEYQMLAHLLAAENTGGHREPITLESAPVWLNTFKYAVVRFLQTGQTASIPESVQQVACTELPQYC